MCLVVTYDKDNEKDNNKDKVVAIPITILPMCLVVILIEKTDETTPTYLFICLIVSHTGSRYEEL